MPNISPHEFETYFPFLHAVEKAEKQEFYSRISIKYFSAGTFICWEGEVCSHLAIVLSGSVRVYKTGKSGREITLYRIEEKESCILTASCILSRVKFPAFAVIEQETRAAVIPAPIVRQWIQEYDIWRQYVFGAMSKRLADVIAVVSEVAFQRVDRRIAEWILKKSKPQEPIAITHQDVADELGTAREVVSRILKDFERERILTLSRGAIFVQNKQALLKKMHSNM
ncbi:MAG: Crp/Fnr family transcriptional regulator [Nitrospiria bacterium]